MNYLNYGMPNYYHQMPSQPPQTPQNTDHGFVWVEGLEEANKWFVAPNSAVQLWDKKDSVIYLKSADATGMQSMRILDYTERDSTPKAGNYITREEFDELAKRIDEIKKEIGNE